MADEFFVNIDGIRGPSLRGGYEGAIEVESWSWGVSNATPTGPGGGGGTGRPQLHELHVTAPVSEASPELVKSCVTGRHHRNAVLVGLRVGKAAFEFVRYEFTDVAVTLVEHSDTEADIPSEHFALAYRTFEVTFTEELADRSAGRQTTASSLSESRAD